MAAKLTEEFERILREEYSSSTMEELCKKLNKNAHAIHQLALKRGLKRTRDQRKGDISVLLNQSLESFYWLGFLAGDGYISKNGHLMVSQSEKDLNLLQYFARFVNSEVHELKNKKSGYATKKKEFRVAVFDKAIGQKIRKLWDISDNKTKTKNGICLNFIKTKEEALAFLCGLIDADGSRNCNYLRIECHASWYEVYKKLLTKTGLKGWSAKVHFKKSHQKDYCFVTINTATTKELYEFANKNNIATASRKIILY